MGNPFFDFLKYWQKGSKMFFRIELQCAVYSVQYTVYSVQYTVCSVQCAVYTVQCALFRVQYTVWNIQSAVCSVQCAGLTQQITLLRWMLSKQRKYATLPSSLPPKITIAFTKSNSCYKSNFPVNPKSPSFFLKSYRENHLIKLRFFVVDSPCLASFKHGGQDIKKSHIRETLVFQHYWKRAYDSIRLLQ